MSQDLIAKIENYASLFFSPKEIAVLLNIDENDFSSKVATPNSEYNKAFNRGQLTSEAELREEILKLAKMGSPAAQIEALKIINRQKLKNG